MSVIEQSSQISNSADGGKAQSALHTLHSNADLFQAPTISRRKYVGGLIAVIRKKLMQLLGPLLAQQVRYNAANLQVVLELSDEVRSLAQAYGQLGEKNGAGTVRKLGGGLTDPRWLPAVWPNWDDLVPPRDLWVGPQDPLSHFFRWIWEYRAYLSLLCGLSEDSAVLEIGCNHGRTAMGLLDFIRPPGRYEGLDILPRQIEFAQQHIQAAYPHFRFTLANIFNAAYNPKGQLSAATYRFPYMDDSFDIVYAASVFTHLLPADVAHYLQESRRVIRADGTCCFSFFVLDYYRGLGTSSCDLYEFNHEFSPGIAVHNPAVPEHVIAYDSSVITQMAREANLTVSKILPGFWSQTRKDGLNEQDIVIFKPA